MVVNSYLMDFTVPESAIGQPNLRHALMDSIEAVFKQQLPGVRRESVLEVEEGFLLILVGNNGLVISVRGYKQGIVTINVEHFKQDSEESLLTLPKQHSLMKVLERQCNGKKSGCLPAIKRGNPCRQYMFTLDECIFEAAIDKVVFKEQSPYQKIEIFHSRNLGNLLVLDDLQNLSESDLIYTETLMQRGVEDYRDKEIIILGGGDGCLLWELLKEKPKHVTMLELDETVIKACRQYLRSSCGNCLDQYKGENYEIIVGDCFVTINKFIEEGKKVDFVFGDLTDFPVDTTGDQKTIDFIKLILNKSMKVLKPGGKYLSHGNGAVLVESLQNYERLLQTLEVPVEFTKASAFIPSFAEQWVFYQVTPQLKSEVPKLF